MSSCRSLQEVGVSKSISTTAPLPDALLAFRSIFWINLSFCFCTRVLAQARSPFCLFLALVCSGFTYSFSFLSPGPVSFSDTKTVDHVAPERPFTGNPSSSLTHVPEAYSHIFHKYDVRNWANFESEAAKMLAFSNSKQLSPVQKATILNIWSIQQEEGATVTEANMTTALKETVLSVTNLLYHYWPDVFPATLGRWKSITSLSFGRSCDFALETTDGSRKVFVVGELKKPADYDLRDPHDASWLKQRLDQSETVLKEDATVRAYLQLFSYILDSEKGIGCLSSYKHFRFFRLDLFRKCIYMSPAVALGQKLSADGQKPHVLQAFLYMFKLDRRTREFTQSKANKVRVDVGLTKYGPKLKKHKKRNKSPAAEQVGGSRRVSATRNVSAVLKNSDYIGKLGDGLIGTEEYEYDGLRVAVKIGNPFNVMLNREVDPAALVSNEITVYEHLKDLQGALIPRVVASGSDRWFTGGGMILVIEKVGKRITKRKEGLFVGDELLIESEADEVIRCALMGLKLIHARNIRHGDVALRNLRVEKVDGKMRVWWIDFGMSEDLVDDEWEGGELEQRKWEEGKREREKCMRMFSAQSVD